MTDAAPYLYAVDIAKDLGVCRATACALIKRIPGAQMLYRYERRRGERWRIARAHYDAWRSCA